VEDFQGIERSNTRPNQTFNENKPPDTGVEQAQPINNKMMSTAEALLTQRQETEEDFLNKSLDLPMTEEIKRTSSQILSKKRPGRVQCVD